MAKQTLAERVQQLEAQIIELTDQIVALKASQPNWRKGVGLIKNDESAKEVAAWMEKRREAERRKARRKTVKSA